MTTAVTHDSIGTEMAHLLIYFPRRDESISSYMIHQVSMLRVAWMIRTMETTTISILLRTALLPYCLTALQASQTFHNQKKKNQFLNFHH